MSTKYKAIDPDKAYFITTTIVDWVKLFLVADMRESIISSLRFCQQNKGLEIYAWVLMPNHLHMLCRTVNGGTIASVMRDFKKFTSKQIIAKLKEGNGNTEQSLLELFSRACNHLAREQDYKVWQDGYHGEEIYSNRFIYQKLNYIHNNPVTAGLVNKPEDYLYSSARNYTDMEGLLEVVLIPPQVITYS